MPCLCFCCAPPGAHFGATAKLCLPPSFSTRGFLHKCLWVGIVVKAVRANHHVKGPRLKGQMLAVPHQKAGIGQVLGLRRLDHAQGQINSGAVFVREFPQQQLDHRAGSAANIQQRLKRILVQFFQNGRVIVLAHLIQSRMAGIIDFCRFGEFPDGHGLVFLFAHAEWAWVPHGDTCPFCIMLASNGWQKASAKLLKGGHASHIHANCDCEFAVRFDGNTGVAGYDPEKYLRQYRAAGSDVNAMRRIDYAARRDAINAQKRTAYKVRKGSTESGKSATIETNKILKQFASEQIFQKHYNKHAKEFGKISAQEYLERANVFADTPLSDDVVQLVRSDGSISKYCFSTNEFVVVTSDGKIRTYFKPATKEAYWDEELERNK